MSGQREWKPGDVAWWEGERIFREDYNENNPGARWMSATNGECWPEEYASADEAPRPLVVIDPEDDGQIDRLYRLLVEQDHTYDKETPRELRHALREFANPTPAKPDEPLGLGAVVESERGNKYVRAGDGWLPETVLGQFRNPIAWDNIAVVRVLSPGYTEDGAS